ncbi:hypothetical protein B0H16DRAFT_1696463 [Mycena metata]|uniref:Novel STAND NTPase 1 domain-containing protein n=1 Tax=Mycena metata TaxID=1033252 RepID=A0AAD7MTI7_9AGAR|nr:hypothetical protein B0H16DRAFT_1696463 [Mycena metata]
MPRQPTLTEIRLKNISTSVAITVNTLNVLVTALKISTLEAISNTTQSLVKMVETIKQDKNECAELMEHIHQLLNAIIGVYFKSDTGAELPPNILNQIAEFTKTLHKIHTFIEAQQSGSKVRKFLRHGELSALLKDCKFELQQLEGLDFFQIKMTEDVLVNAREMQAEAQLRHREVLSMIETLSSSDSVSSLMCHLSSNSISMLPAEPKIFHGRDSELAEILKLFDQDNPRIAILGAGGMGKTSLARTALHHEEVITKYQGNRFFIACDTASNKVELAGLIGAHLGMKPGKDLTRAVLWHFSDGPRSLLILDNLETVWEPVESRKEIEEFLSLLTEIASLALVITMRGAERPAKVQWSRPFLLPLQPLAQDAARKMFIDIADDRHSIEEVDQVLHLTDNMPLSISLLAHLVDMEDCHTILSRWEKEKISLISAGYDKRSNLELSISLSLSSPRITSMPQAPDLLALLSILPDGLSDVELKQSQLPIQDVLGCKAALLRTALAYTDDHRRLKVLVPVREYMTESSPPTDQMIMSLLTHFHELLELYVTAFGTESGALPIGRITANYANIQNVLRFNQASRITGHGERLLEEIISLLPSLGDHRLKVHVIIELFRSFAFDLISEPENLIAQAIDHVKDLNDPKLECRLHASLIFYYSEQNPDVPKAIEHGQAALFLAQANDDHASQSNPLQLFGDKGQNTSYPVWYDPWGHELCPNEYVEAHNIQNQLLQDTQATHGLYQQRAYALINTAEVEVLMGFPKDVIQKKIDTAQSITKRMKNAMLMIACDMIQADLNLREGDRSERLGNNGCWEGAHHLSSWTTVFLAHSLKAKERLGIHKALQFLGDIFLSKDDEVTAVSLFILALEGFTEMDVHHSRAECMIRLGDISKKNSDLLEAMDLWETARPLFERSSQTKQVQDIDERLRSVMRSRNSIGPT